MAYLCKTENVARLMKFKWQLIYKSERRLEACEDWLLYRQETQCKVGVGGFLMIGLSRQRRWLHITREHLLDSMRKLLGATFVSWSLPVAALSDWCNNPALVC